MNFDLNEDEFETLKDLFSDHGSDCPYTDDKKLQALGEKLGILEPIPPFTEEELKQKEEFRNSPTGKMLTELFKTTNLFMEKMAQDFVKNNIFASGEQWPIGTKLRINLPNDYFKERIRK